MATSYPAFARAIAAAAPIPFAAPVMRAALRVDAIASPCIGGVVLAAAHYVKKSQRAIGAETREKLTKRRVRPRGSREIRRRRSGSARRRGFCCHRRQ